MAEQSETRADLHGKVALVTGGASGIGRAVVRALAGAGAKVAVADVTDNAGRTAAEEVGGAYVHLDVGDAANWDIAVEDVTDQLGGIDIVHLGAGEAIGEPDLTKITDDAYRRAMSVNVDGVVYGARAAIPGMRLRGGGVIVATASLGGLTPMPWDPLYSMTKHAVIGLVRSLASGLERDRIRINAVCPGFTDTPLATERSRASAKALGVPLLDASAVAEVIATLVRGRMTGEAWFVQPGREAAAFRFGRVPGHRA